MVMDKLPWRSSARSFLTLDASFSLLMLFSSLGNIAFIFSAQDSNHKVALALIWAILGSLSIVECCIITLVEWATNRGVSDEKNALKRVKTWAVLNTLFIIVVMFSTAIVINGIIDLNLILLGPQLIFRLVLFFVVYKFIQDLKTLPSNPSVCETLLSSSISETT